MTLSITSICAANRSVFVGVVSNNLNRTGLLSYPQIAVLADAVYHAMPSLVDGYEDFMTEVEFQLETAQLVVEGRLEAFEPMEYDLIAEALNKGRMFNKDNTPSKAFEKVIKANATPRHAVSESTRGDYEFKHSRRVDQRSKLMLAAMEMLESTQYTIDTTVLKVAEMVYNTDARCVDALGKRLVCDAQYVLDGAKVHVSNGNEPSFSEFYPDWRGRLYHGACHGANGQAGDLDRALMAISGMSMEYTPKTAVQLLEREMGDMVKCDLVAALNYVRSNGMVVTVYNALTGADSVAKCIKKPWSFIKAAFEHSQLLKHIANPAEVAKPYISTVVGLDAKGSGPQIAALLTGDSQIAASCGFSNQGDDVPDVYARVNLGLNENGFGMLGRDLAKGAYVGIYYGQSEKAYTDPENFGANTKNLSLELRNYIAGMTNQDFKTNGATFHNIVKNSLGTKVSRLISKIPYMHYTVQDGERVYLTSTKKAMSYTLPDGYKVKFKKRVSFDLLGIQLRSNKEATEFYVNGYKYSTAFASEIVDVEYQARTGFVNLIQSCDALLARLIITNLRDLGAKHAIAVHDCFRVSVADAENSLLEKAIQLAYAQMFGEAECGYFQNNFEGIHNKDILAMYTKGVYEACNHKGLLASGEEMSMQERQYINRKGTWVKRVSKVNGQPIEFWINQLVNAQNNTGSSYFFCK